MYLRPADGFGDLIDVVECLSIYPSETLIAKGLSNQLCVNLFRVLRNWGDKTRQL
jgi:hypothetical protein